MNFLFPTTLNRKQYFLRWVTLLVLIMACFALEILIVVPLSLLPDLQTKHLSMYVMGPLIVLLIAPLLLAFSRFPCLDIPRLRSIGWSPWLVLLFLIPVVNLALQICLICIAPSVDYSDDEQEGRRSPEVRVLFWSASILITLIMGNGVFFMYFSSHPVNHRSVFAPGPAAQSEAPQKNTASGPLKLVNSNLQVQSIFFQNSSRSSAVVNGNSVMVGEHVDKWVVTEISSNSVTFHNTDGETSIVQFK